MTETCPRADVCPFYKRGFPCCGDTDEPHDGDMPPEVREPEPLCAGRPVIVPPWLRHVPPRSPRTHSVPDFRNYITQSLKASPVESGVALQRGPIVALVSGVHSSELLALTSTLPWEQRKCPQRTRPEEYRLSDGKIPA